MRKLLRCLVAGVFLAGCWLTAQNLAVTDVQGESWLRHLARDFNETSMGKTGRLGPSEAMPGDDIPRWESQPLPVLATQTVAVRGADLYRMNCRGCHGESGFGAPPEINSVINPVRSTSVALVMERMKTVGMDVNPATAAEMAKQSRKALLLRLHQGGENMPPFSHLSEPEIRALMAYLKQLAGVSGAEREQVTLRVSRVRVGEHIAKSTCHICHSATGADPSSQQILDGAIPPLSALTTRKDLSGFVRKVTQGAPVLMGAPPLLCRGRMPVFGYLSEDEAEDVYVYLTLYPTRASTTATATASIISIGSEPPSGASPANRPSLPTTAGEGDPQPISLVRFAVFPIVLFLFLGSITAKYLPLLAKADHDRESGIISFGASVSGQPTAAAVEIGGEGAPAMRSGVSLDQVP
jgi:mono/diheme cytochrome c family protein